MTLESYDKLLSSVLQEYKILAEYKRLASENLSGVYVIPSYENTFLWFGVIFIRSGIYKDGIFRFHITLPDTFPDDSTPPTVIFQSEIFHPLICPYNGTLELVDAFPTWTKDNYIWQILKYIQYIFYNFEDYSSVSEKFLNKNAVELYHQNRPEFLGHVSECIKLSHEKLHAPPPTQDKNYIVFGKFDAEIHGAILESIKKNGTTDSQQPNSGLSWVKEGVFHPLSK